MSQVDSSVSATSRQLEEQVGLSSDIIQYLTISYLSVNDMVKLSCCCTRLNSLINTNSCWLEFVRRDIDISHVPDDIQPLLKEEMDSDKLVKFNVEIRRNHSFPESFPTMKMVYCMLRDQWEFEEKEAYDIVTTSKKVVERVDSQCKNPSILCTLPFVIKEQTTGERFFHYRSYVEFKIKCARTWLAIGVAEVVTPRHNGNVLGNLTGVTSFAYYSDSSNPTFNLNGKILSNCNLRTLKDKDIVGVHVYSVKDHSALIHDNPDVSNLRDSYIKGREETSYWSVFVSMYLNGQIIAELPLMKLPDIARIHPAVALSKSSKVRVLSSLGGPLVATTLTLQ